MVMYILLYLKWITNKGLLYSIGNSAQCYVPAWMGGEFGEKQMKSVLVALLLLLLSRVSRVQLFVTPWTVSPPGPSVHGTLQARILE